MPKIKKHSLKSAKKKTVKKVARKSTKRALRKATKKTIKKKVREQIKKPVKKKVLPVRLPERKSSQSGTQHASKKKPVKKTVKKIGKKTTTKKPLKKLIVALGTECFWVHEGPKLKDLQDLAQAFKNMRDYQFSHHTKKQNDFANWVEKILVNKSCASALRKATTRSESLFIITRVLKKYT